MNTNTIQDKNNNNTDPIVRITDNTVESNSLWDEVHETGGYFTQVKYILYNNAVMKVTKDGYGDGYDDDDGEWVLDPHPSISIQELEEKITNYNQQNGGGKKKTQRRKSKPKKKNPKIYTGKRGGKYYLKNGHKIYI